MSDILSEEKADKEVIKSLLREIKRLKGRNPMSEAKTLFDINGDVYRATEFEKLTEDDLRRELSEAQSEAGRIEEAIAYSNKLQSGATVAQGQESSPTTPAPQPTPEVPTTPEVPSTPEVPATETPAPAQPENQQFDPATAPAPQPVVLQ